MFESISNSYGTGDSVSSVLFDVKYDSGTNGRIHSREKVKSELSIPPQFSPKSC